MNKIVKKVVAFSSLLVMLGNVVACQPEDNGWQGALEQGFWSDLAETTGGSTGGNGPQYSGDVQINGDPTAAVAYDGSPVTIQFYHTMGQKLQIVLDDWIPAFNAMYPNITVVHGSKGGYPELRDLITTELNGTQNPQVNGYNGPHIAYCYPDHVALYKSAGAVATLDDYIASTKLVTKNDGSTEQMGLTQEQANSFVRAYYEEGRAYGNGKMYTLPYSKSTEVLYYNKTFFEANNFEVPTTWDEMEMLIQQIVEIDPTCVPLGYDSEANWFITMTEQLGTPYTSSVSGQKFLFDVEANHSFVGRLRKWYQLGLVTTEETYGAYTSDLFTQTDPNKMKSYMTIGSSAGASYQCPDTVTNENNEVVYPFEVGVALPPQIDPENPKVISQGPSLCMFKKANKQEMAATWLFMKFLTTNMGLQANFSEVSGYAPVISKLDTKMPEYAAFLANANDLNAQYQGLPAACVKQCILQESAMFVSPAFIGSSGARDKVGELLQNCFVNQPEAGQTEEDFVKANFTSIVDKLRYDYGN